jgi:hypothetical protein
VAKHARWLLLCILAVGIARIVAHLQGVRSRRVTNRRISRAAYSMSRSMSIAMRRSILPLTRAMIAVLPYLNGHAPRGKPTFQLEGWDIITLRASPRANGDADATRQLPSSSWAVRGLPCGAALFRSGGGRDRRAVLHLIPTILAHAGLATTDMGLAATSARHFSPCWLGGEAHAEARRDFRICMALALLSKFTTLGFFPMAPRLRWRITWQPAARRVEPRSQWRRSAPPVSESPWECASSRCGRPSFSRSGPVPFWNVSLPGGNTSTAYAWRCSTIRRASGVAVGEARRFGWWYYFPVALAVKTPLAMLAMAGIGIVVCWRNHKNVAI